IHNLAGNTQLMKQARYMTKAVDPKRHAVWTLAALYERLCEWAYDVHDTLDHPALGQSPREAYATAWRTSGERPQRAVVYLEEFCLWTFPTPARGKARVVPGRGVKANYIFYWSSAFRDPAVEQTLVPVRYDPYNAGIAFAYAGKRWVECLSEHYASLRGRSERELMIASAELRKRGQTHARQSALTARKLVDFRDYSIFTGFWYGARGAFIVEFWPQHPPREDKAMFGPGAYRPDATEGITAIADLPPPEIVPYRRTYERQACPRCTHQAYRDKQFQRRLHDLGNLDVLCPRDLEVTYSQHYCTKSGKYFNADLYNRAPPGGQYTHRVIDLAVRLVVEDGLPYRPASWHLWRDHRVFVPFATIQNWVEAGGKKGAGAHGHGLP